MALRCNFCCNKSPRQRNVQSDLTLHFRVGGYQFSSIYVIVFKLLRLQRVRIRCVFKSFHSGDRFQKFAVTVYVCVFAGYVWTLSVTATKCLRIQTNSDTCGRDGVILWILWILWGGFFERLVRCVKRCLKKTLKNARVSFEEFETVLTQVEGIVNSRPLTYVHEEMSEPLTPSTLCFGRRLLSNPLPQERKVNKNLVDDSRRRERFLTRILNHFWERWRKEYLTELRERHKVRNGSTGNSISHGDVVVVHEDKIPRQLWKVGRV